MILLDLNEAFEKIISTKGRFFSAVFTKKDGTDRYIRGRLGVHKGLKGKGLNYNPKMYGLVNMYDLDAKGYRMVTLETLKSLQVDGVVYSIRR